MVIHTNVYLLASKPSQVVRGRWCCEDSRQNFRIVFRTWKFGNGITGICWIEVLIRSLNKRPRSYNALQNWMVSSIPLANPTHVGRGHASPALSSFSKEPNRKAWTTLAAWVWCWNLGASQTKIGKMRSFNIAAMERSYHPWVHLDASNMWSLPNRRVTRVFGDCSYVIDCSGI